MLRVLEVQLIGGVEMEYGLGCSPFCRIEILSVVFHVGLQLQDRTSVSTFSNFYQIISLSQILSNKLQHSHYTL